MVFRIGLLKAALLLFAGFALLASIHPSAQAQGLSKTIKFNNQLGLFNMGVSLLRNPELPSTHFIIRIAPENRMLTGCIDMQDFGYQANFVGNALEIQITEASVKADNLTNHPHLKCNGNLQTPKADIPLNRDELLERNIRFIRFKGSNLIDNYDLVLKPEKIQLVPSMAGLTSGAVTKKQNIYRVKDPLTLWFYPENTVIAYVPGADKSQKIRSQVDELATQKGFQPLEAVYPAFVSPISVPHHYYYVDQNAHFSGDYLLEKGLLLDYIDVEEVLYGLEKDETAINKMAVFIKTPGLYE